ncbi:Lipolytic protein G-D-S-L family [Carbonactinospora thermoautotrophica]|uniref:Lipolytic protein G-D-S-L family n=1 Tax=Carbonactinospora thermoautotrophica TaxID=1469144 RepID=A0A132MN30_9ACTN|nr:SGNH/GDSL hydrolase family protein [Carbonactinospora thermoautotrophica]KWW99135.1 Lipolytic protein G-D-S-L family [Carbonactinospora thermoautotrophica]
MSRARAARRIVKAAAYGGGGIGVLTGAFIGLIMAEAKLARMAIGTPFGDPPRADGVYGDHYPGEPISFVLIGDSSAAGLGVEHPYETPGGLLAGGLASLAERPVRLTSVAKVGAQSYDLEWQVDLALEARPDIAVIMIGANDVTHRVPPSTSVRLLTEAVRRLRAANCEVVVGTCPDLGTIEPIAQPLRWIARRWSRRLAAAQTIAVVENGGRTVSLGDLLGPEFEANPREMFSSDRFHPSAAGYATAAMAILPTMAAALGVWPEDEPLDALRGEGVLPVAFAAVEAAESAGTEVVGATTTGRAEVRHRDQKTVPKLREAAREGAAEVVVDSPR